MTASFIEQIFQHQEHLEEVPHNESIAHWASRLICLLFPELSETRYDSALRIQEDINLLKLELVNTLNATQACASCDNLRVANTFFEGIPEIYRLLNTDVDAIMQGDPAAHSEFEIIRAYPGFLALSYYRIAHHLLRLDVPLLPRILTEHAHSRTGIDIHPAAEIGEYCMIDHGTGVVIGETAQLGKHVKIYQGVTLGAMSVDKKLAKTKRHPTIQDHVILYSGATVLGGDTVVGEGSVIGGNVWLTRSVPPGSLVYHNPEITVVQGNDSNRT